MSNPYVTQLAAQAMLAARDPARAQSQDRAVRKAPPTFGEALEATLLLDSARIWITENYMK